MSLSNNAYGIPDAVLMQIQNEARKTLLFEQMHSQFGPMADMVKELDRRVTKLERELADDDDDGTPNFMDMAKKAGEMAQAGSEVKRVFSGGKLFG